MDRGARPARVTVALVFAGVLGLATSEPAAALVPIDTRTTITVTTLSATTATYSGKLTTRLKKGKPDSESRRAARNCLRGRNVSISNLGREFGSAVTDGKGNWSITGPKPAPGGDVKVLVARDVRKDVLCGVISVHSQPIF
jgi:hypothetical protein